MLTEQRKIFDGILKHLFIRNNDHLPLESLQHGIAKVNLLYFAHITAQLYYIPNMHGRRKRINTPEIKLAAISWKAWANAKLTTPAPAKMDVTALSNFKMLNTKNSVMPTKSI